MHGLLSTELYLDGCFADFFAFLQRDSDLVLVVIKMLYSMNLGVKLLYKLVCPSVTRSDTHSVTNVSMLYLIIFDAFTVS